MYQILFYIHVLSAIVAAGYNATYAVWSTRGRLLITGIAQVIMSHRSWHQTWIELAIVLWDDPEYAAVDRRSTVLGLMVFRPGGA